MTDRPPPSTPLRRFYIFPAIGIARVGDSRLHTYLAGESPSIDFVPEGGYRGPEEEVAPDEQAYRLPEIGGVGQAEPMTSGSSAPPAHPEGSTPTIGPVLARRIKRMGCRFRIYEFDADGAVIGEVTADDAQVEWTVRLVNKKAAGDADWGYGQLTGPLNPGPTADELTIEADGTVAGAEATQEMAGVIMGGTAAETPVKLGDLETDRRGRLIVFGGHGVAGSWERPSPFPNLIRNPGWYDDTSDGTVDATVTIDGISHQAVGARVVIGPPDYVHPCIAPVTLFDLAFDCSGGTYPDTSFTQHIHPILHRAAFLEWTLFGILGMSYGRSPKHGHGFTGNHDMHPDGAFLDASVFATLHDPDSAIGSDRRDFYFRWLKDPALSPEDHGGQGAPRSMPAIEHLTFTPVQYTHFERLSQGTFASDWPLGRRPDDLDPTPFRRLADADRPVTLNRAAMDFAVGGPFLPGFEVGAAAADAATYVGSGLPDPEVDFRVADTVEAGDLTQSLAVPWQTALNHHNYDDGAGDTADNLWPSARPVLVPAKRGGVDDEVLWTRPLTQTGRADIFENQKLAANVTMIEIWSKLGFIAPRRFYVEISRTLPEDPADID